MDASVSATELQILVPDDQQQLQHFPSLRLLSRKRGSTPVALVRPDYLTPLRRMGANK